MKIIILFSCLFVSALMNCQEVWRPIGADDFNKASYGTTNYGSEAVRSNRLTVKNGTVYVMNLEMEFPGKGWLVLGKYSNGQWQHIETPFWSNSEYQIISYSFAVDNNEVPYLFLNDPLNSHKSTVKKYDGTSWVDVGGPVSTTSSNILEIVVGNDNLPFILYSDATGIKTKKFDGTSWINIPSSDLDGLTRAVVRLDQNDVPYLLYSYQSGSSPYSFLKKLNGLQWEEVGITDFSGSGSGLCIGLDNQPYIFVSNILRQFNGTSWQTIASPPGSTYNLKLVTDADGNLYAAGPNSSMLNKVVYKLTGGSWQNLAQFPSYGPIEISVEGNTVYEQHTETTNHPVVNKRSNSEWEKLGDESEMPDSHTSQGSFVRKYHDLSIINGLPIVAYKNLDSNLSVKQVNANGVWSFVGNPNLSEQNIFNAKLATDSNGDSYVGYLNIVNSSPPQSLLTVKKLVGNNWDLVGALNFSMAAEIYMDFKINTQNVPYVVYKSGRVQKYTGSSWEFVGGSAYTGDKEVQLAFDNDDQPFIIHGSGLAVKKFNGTIWEEVGTESLSPFVNATSPQIACDSENNILIAFVHFTTRKIHVLKWNGSVWQQLGPEIDTNITGLHSNNFIKLSIDQNNFPHIMFNRNYNNFRNMGNVVKFNGTSWEPVGDPDFTPAIATAGTMIFADENIPIVVYTSSAGLFCKYFGEEDELLTTDDYIQAEKGSFLISPNPATSYISISVAGKIDSIDIFDLAGKKVFSGIDGARMDISALQNGMYVVKIISNEGYYTAKFLKK